MARIVVLGAGFAGLWAAIGAARKRDEIGAGDDIEICVVDRNPYHNIRVRNYEVDLSDVALPLAQLLDPIGVSHVLGEVEAIDPAQRRISLVTRSGEETLAYDRLVLALGSEVMRPDIPGLADHAFDVDTYAAALRLEAHLVSLGRSAPSPGRSTVVVVGAGFTGIEVAAEMPDRLARAGVTRQPPHHSGRSQPCSWRHHRRACAPRDRDGVVVARGGDASWRPRRVHRERGHSPEFRRVHRRANRDLVRRHARESARGELSGRARSPRAHPGRPVHAG